MRAQPAISNRARTARRLLPSLSTVLSLLFLYSCATTGTIQDEPVAAVTGKSRVERRTTEPTPDQITEEPAFYRIPDAGPDFWADIMTSDVAFQYRAINGVSQCTIFVADVIDEYFGEDLFSLVFSYLSYFSHFA